MTINLSFVEGTSEKLRRDPFSTLKTPCVNFFVNQKIKQLQKIKTTSFMKLTVVTAKQFTLVSLNGL